MFVRRWIVVGLERACSVVDWLPAPWHDEDGWHLGPAFYGCRLGLALRSADLDERWGTEVWG